MKRIVLLTLSHLALVGAGYGLHLMSKNPPREAATESKPEGKVRPPVLAPLPPDMTQGDSPWSAADFRKAWRALGTLRISPGELKILRAELLKEWSVKDLRSALIAVTNDKTYTSEDLNAFGWMHSIDRSEELFDWIMAGDFGLAGRDVLRFWGFWGTARNPELPLQLIGRVPPAFERTFFEQVFGKAGPTQIDMIAKLPDERLKTLAWKSLLEGAIESAWQKMGPDQTHELLAMEGIPKEARESALRKYADTLMSTASLGQSADNFRRLSAEDQQFLGPRLLAEAERRSFNAEMVSAPLSMLMESGQWDLLSERGPGVVDKVFDYDGADLQAMARWAQEIPVRDEAKDLYRHAVAGRFRNDLNGSRDWALSLPEGWHRDQALAQLAMTADSRKNAGVRDQALDGIMDTAIREEMREWRQKDAAAK